MYGLAQMYPFSRFNLVNTQPVNTKYGPVCGYPTISLFVLIYLYTLVYVCMFEYTIWQDTTHTPT